MINPTAKFTDEELIDCLNEGLSDSAIARKFGVHRKSVYRRKQKLQNKGELPVPEGHSLKGTSTLYDANGNVKVQWVKSQVDAEKQKQLIEEIASALKEDLPKVEPKSPPKNINESLLSVYPLGDPHIGMLAWAEEVGDNWDLEIAERVFCTVFDRVVRTTPNSKLGLIVNLGDYFHYDNMDGVTARSKNILDRDGRYAKMVRIGVAIMRQLIETALTKHESVGVINVTGNHDETGSLFLTTCLAHIYENEPRVTIDISPALYHFLKFGKVLLGAHHGHTCKMDKLPSVMAAMKPREWGDTLYRYWLTGHIHHDSKKEFPGCMVESFRTLAGPDAYAISGGWMSGRDTKAIVYHAEYGEIERHTVNLPRGFNEEK